MSNLVWKLHKIKTKNKIFIILSIVLTVIILIDHQIRPLVKSIASNRAKIVSVTLINEAVLEELNKNDIDYSEMIILDKDQSGRVVYINTDMKKINYLKSTITLSVQKKLACVKKKEFYIPLGSLTGTEILNGRGPRVPLKVNLSGSVITDLKSKFESGGINQTKHQIYLEISTKVCAFIPGYPVDTSVDTSILISETVLVGDIPQFFAGIK